MRAFGLLSLCLLLYSRSLFAAEFPLEIIENFDGTKVAIYVKESAIADAPAWTPAAGEPPLTIAALIQAVNGWLTLEPTLAGATITKIELKPIRHHEAQQRWYYLVQLQPAGDRAAKPRYLAALMSGKVLSAIKEPSAYK